MRHRKRKGSLGRMPDHRDATLRNLVRGLFISQRIRTTLAKAKEARRLAERLITIGKQDDIVARRKAFSILTDRDMVSKLFKEIAPLFKDRHGGYTRIIHMGFRRGDAATMVLLELTEKKIIEKVTKKKQAKKAEKPAKGEARKEQPKGIKPGAKVKEEKPRPKTKIPQDKIAQPTEAPPKKAETPQRKIAEPTAGQPQKQEQPPKPKAEKPKDKIVQPTEEQPKKEERPPKQKEEKPKEEVRPPAEEKTDKKPKFEERKRPGEAKGFFKNLRDLFRKKPGK